MLASEIHSRKILLIIIALIHNAKRITTSNMVRIMCGSWYVCESEGISMHFSFENYVFIRSDSRRLWIALRRPNSERKKKKMVGKTTPVQSFDHVLEHPPMCHECIVCVFELPFPTRLRLREWLTGNWRQFSLRAKRKITITTINATQIGNGRKGKSHDACKSRTMAVCV